MKLHLKPEEIKRLTRKMLHTIANCEIRSQQNGAEAEVFYVCKTPEKRKGRYAHYYVIVEATKSGFSAELYIDDSLTQHKCLCCYNTIDEMQKTLPNKIEELNELNLKIKRDMVAQNPKALRNQETFKEKGI